MREGLILNSEHMEGVVRNNSRVGFGEYGIKDYSRAWDDEIPSKQIYDTINYPCIVQVYENFDPSFCDEVRLITDKEKIRNFIKKAIKEHTKQIDNLSNMLSRVS